MSGPRIRPSQFITTYGPGSIIEASNGPRLIKHFFDGVFKDVNNHIPNSRVLEILKGNMLYTVASKILQEGRYTEWYDETSDCVVEKSEFSMLDHILLWECLRVLLWWVVLFFVGYHQVFFSL